MSDEAAEMLIFERGAVRITNLRAQFANRTYPVRQIAGVIRHKKPAERTFAVLAIVAGVLLIGATIIVVAVSMSGSSQSNPGLCGMCGGGGGFLALIIGGIAWASASDRYIVALETSGGRVDAFVSSKPKDADDVAAALNEAIVRYS